MHDCQAARRRFPTPGGFARANRMENFAARERRGRAIKAAARIAASYHVKSDAPVLLKDSNNTIVHLAPAPVVAKVAAPSTREQNVSNLRHELNVALHLKGSGAPIVPPSDDIPPAVYRFEELEVTFWRHCPGEVREEIDRRELVAAIRQFHAAFAGYPGTLQPFTAEYEMCYALLNRDRLSPELPAAERQFLRRVYEHLIASLHAFDYEHVPVHTEVHGGNVIWTERGPLLIDFESCCRGPRELDFLPFSERNLLACQNLDRELMGVLGDLRSFRVAVWCWLQPTRAPEVREAAQYHLSRLQSLY